MTALRTAQRAASGVEGGNNNNDTPRLSSSPDLSTPPRSLSDPASPAQQLNNEYRESQKNGGAANADGVEVKEEVVAPPVKERKKPGRKPKNADPNAVVATEAPKVRKPRKPRDPNAPPIQRKRKGAAAEANPIIIESQPQAILSSRQSKITEMPLRPSEPTPNATAEPVQSSQKSKNEDIQRPLNTFFSVAPPPPPPPQPVQPQLQAQPPAQTQPQAQPQPPSQPQTQVRSVGQAYDPIRYDPVRENVVAQNPYPTSQQSSPKPAHLVNRASASPSISSLVDPPHQTATSPSLAAQSFFSHQQKLQNFDNRTPSVPPSPTVLRLAPSPMMKAAPPPQPTFVNTFKIDKQPQPQAQPEPYVRVSAPTQSPAPAPATIPATAAAPQPSTISKTAPSSAAPSPKPPKSIDITPPPLPGSGSGLLQNGIFGDGPKDGTDTRAPTIVLHIPMNGESNKYVNFTKLAEERYGWDALHPRLAAQRERLARVAAAGAALEKSGSHKESGDEMSLDMSEGEGSNVEMGGMSDGRTGTDGGVKKKKRKMKEDEYDKEDDFIDDSEQLWEEQAAASKDGFFVYAGPLVQEVQKPLLERDGPPKRGRGGRGRGGSTRGTGSGRGGGPGSRGGTTTRKPRITKADRARMELEKAEREKMGTLAAKPSTYGGLSHLAVAASMGGTPMVFNQ